MAKTLGIPKEKVRVMSPYIGGGFGAKLWLRADALLAALGARAARRPVKVALQRALMPNNTVHRSATIQRIRIGAAKDGKITAIAHESWSGDLPGRQAGGRGGADALALRRRQPHDGEPARRARPARSATRCARPTKRPAWRRWKSRWTRWPRSSAWIRSSSASSTTRRSCRTIRRKPASADPQSKAPQDKPNPASAVLAAAAGRVLAAGREALRLGQAQRAARPGARRALARRHGRGRGLPRQPADEVGGARAPRPARHRDRRDRHDRHRHRQLHGHRADRRRDDGRAAGQGRRAPGRLELPGVVRLGRAVGRQQLDRGRLCRLHEAARSRRAEGRVQRGRCGLRRRPGPRRARAASRSPRRPAIAASSRKTSSSSATSTSASSNRPSARTSSRSASMPPPARRACGACSPSARPGASSIPRPRAAR